MDRNLDQKIIWPWKNVPSRPEAGGPNWGERHDAHFNAKEYNIFAILASLAALAAVTGAGWWFLSTDGEAEVIG